MILADEPTGALDSATSAEIMRLLQEVNREGVTVVVVTHEREVAAMTRRIVRLRDGRIEDSDARLPEAVSPAPGPPEAGLTAARAADV
jgi:putative ABC transport system ATP-binding protein